MTGKVVYHSATQNEQTITLNTSRFANGIYLIRKDYYGKTATQKLVVNR
ncbi:MAG: T9SS type A sorting domain-containing protein [Bacteroidia bacterium]